MRHYKLDAEGKLKRVTEEFVVSRYIAVRLEDVFEVVDSLTVLTEEKRREIKDRFLEKALDIGAV